MNLLGKSIAALAVSSLALVAARAEEKPATPPPAPDKAAAAAPAAKPAEKVTLALRAQVGQVARHKAEITMRIEAGEAKATIAVKQTDKITYTAVAPSGEITLERETESLEMALNGEKVPNEEDKTKDTLTVRPDGTIIAYKSTETDKDEVRLGARLYLASSPVFPATPVGVGDQWSHDYKADAILGTEAAHADFEVVAFEKLGAVDAVKVKMTYRETGAAPAISGKGFVWIEKTSGDTVVADYALENVPMGPAGPNGQRAVATGTVREERASGGPLPGSAVADASAAKGEPKKDKTIDETVKDYEKLPGLLTLYRKREDGKDTIYAEIREDQLGRLMMLEATASTGTAEQIVAGDPINDLVFKFTRSGDDRVLLTVPNIAFRASGDKPISRAVRRSFADAILEAYKIEARQPDRNSVLINISELFRGDIAQVSAVMGGYALDRDKTYIASVKNFAENLVVETQYQFMRGGRPGFDFGGGGTLADARSAPVRVNYTLFALPEKGYQPRLADGRVGYFVTEYQNFDVDDRDEPIVRYLYRWNLEKADPAAKLSPPKKAIVFWLDNAIPTEYRAAVRDGILLWNRAFERVGIKNAIVVNQMPDNADWDHADMRYNTIRWVASPDAGYAVALFRVNPLTGQILNANITVDANMVRYLKMERKELVEPSAAFTAGAGIEASDVRAQAAKRGKSLNAFDPRSCTMAAEKMEQAWFGHAALSMIVPAGARISERDYINMFLREVVAHEMGHVLGLRHNFIASMESSLDQLKDPAYVKQHGITASVMDYNPFNLAALKVKGVDFFSQTVGAYDLWAIEYGYTPVPGANTPEAELPRLKQIARRSNEPGHGYQSDEIADQFDPLVARFDLSADPIAYWTRMLQTSRYLLVNLDKRMPRSGESYWEFTKAFYRLLGMHAQAAGYASRYIGGLHVNRNYKGDPGEKPTLAPISVAKQKEALALLNTYVFSPAAFSFPDRYYTHLTANPQMSWSDFASGAQQDFPVRDRIAGIQQSALRRLFSGSVLARVANNEFKMGGDAARALTLPTLFNSVGGTVWAELGAKGSNIPTLRRQLQRAYVDTMITMCVDPMPGTPEDAKMLAWNQLRRLKAQLTAARAGASKRDEYTRVHLDETLMRVNRTLDARVMIGNSGGSSGASLLQLLLGGEAKGTAEAAPKP